MFDVDLRLLRIDKHWCSVRLSDDWIFAGGCRRPRWKISIVDQACLHEFEMVFDVVLIAKEEQAAVLVSAQRVIRVEWSAVGNPASKQTPCLSIALRVGFAGVLVPWVGFPDMSRQRTNCSVRVVAEFEVVVQGIAVA